MSEVTLTNMEDVRDEVLSHIAPFIGWHDTHLPQPCKRQH